nr:unnamed protein product [Callosobruchus chinensis]
MNVPTTFIIESLDKTMLPTNLLVVLLKNIFRFGRLGINVTSDEQVHLMLSYSPKHETVQKKLKLLPVKYLRVFADTEEEFKLLSTGLKRFKELNFFPLEDEEVTSEPVPSTSSSSSSSGAPPPPKKQKRLSVNHPALPPELPQIDPGWNGESQLW